MRRSRPPDPGAVRRPPPPLVLGGLGALLLVALGVGVVLGPVSIPWAQAWAAVGRRLGWPGGADVSSPFALIVGQLRLPRVLSAALVGGSLAASGTVMQGLFHNALASPYLLGIASGASAGAAGVIVLGWQGRWGGLGLALGAWLGGLLAVAVVYRLATLKGSGRSATTLILAGVALGALFSALTSFLIFLSGEQMREIVFWILGGLGRARWRDLGWLAPITLGGTLGLLVYLRELNALTLGDRGARALGIRPQRLQRGLLLLITLMTSAAVALAGTVGFVGLITPHALRLVVGPDHRLLLPASALGGALFLVLADTLARTLWAPLELPVGILTAFTGAPFFLYLLLRRRGELG